MFESSEFISHQHFVTLELVVVGVTHTHTQLLQKGLNDLQLEQHELHPK